MFAIYSFYIKNYFLSYLIILLLLLLYYLILFRIIEFTILNNIHWKYIQYNTICTTIVLIHKYYQSISFIIIFCAFFLIMISGFTIYIQFDYYYYIYYIF